MSTAYATSALTGPPPSPSSSAPRRIACDRCHGQKLKCPRDINSGEPCTRCAKAGAICQVSPARATGRPAKNPKPQHRKSESTASINSSRPSLTESASSVEDTIVTPNAKLAPAFDNVPMTSAEDYFPTTSMPLLPMNNEMSKFYSSPEIPFDFVDVMDPTYMNSMGFEYNDGHSFINFGQVPTMTPSVFHQDSSPMFVSQPFSATTFGPMPPPPTPSISLQGEGSDNHSSLEDFRLDDRSSRSNSFTHDFSSHDVSTESVPKPTLPRTSSSLSNTLKRSYTTSNNSLPTANLSIRTKCQDESLSKKRRFSGQINCTPEHEQAWSSNLSYSQALSSIQFEVDNFSKSLMNQSIRSNPGTGSVSDANVDVGVLLPISDKFVALVPQICRQASGLPQTTPKSRNSSLKHFIKPSLERAQTEPDSTTIGLAAAESSSIESGLVQLIFACNTRLHFAFSIALDVISHNLSAPVSPSQSPNHPSTSIGSYTLPTTSPLSTLLHLHAISHSLDRLDATLHKNLDIESVPTAGFFEGIFCKQKRNEMAVHAFKERAFEESNERKNLLMSRIREIVAEVAGNEI